MSDAVRSSVKVAIVGAGEMGAAVARRLRDGGARVAMTLKGRSAASVERVREMSLEVVDDDDAFIRDAGFIVSIVPPGQAAAVAERLHPALGRARTKPIFVECNAVSPATVRRIADRLATTGCKFIDAGIIGGPPRAGDTATGPRFYASGPDAKNLIELRAYGLDVQLVNGALGAASALKLSYAGLTKGVIALGAAMIGGATRDGVASALRDELARSQPQLLAYLAPRISAMFPKAYRWIAEMEQIAQFLDGDETGAGIYNGAAQFYSGVARQYQSDGPACALVTILTAFFAAANRRVVN
ncbi:MAG: DUF1932 domain-containing protein [Candidatus Binataceae bacterium]